MTKGEELIVIPRKEYDQVLRILKQKKDNDFDRKLDKIIAEVDRGETFGPFKTAKALVKSLNAKK